MVFDIKRNNKEIKPHAHTHHVVIVVIIVDFAILNVCYSITLHTTLILFYHASMLTLQYSLLSRALWLPQVCSYKSLYMIPCANVVALLGAYLPTQSCVVGL